MQGDRSACRQRIGDPLQQLRRQVDFRHQDQHLPAGRDAIRGGSEIDLRLAAAGDSLEQKRRERSRCVDDGGRRVHLIGVERRAGRSWAAAGPWNVAIRRHRLDPAGGLPAPHRVLLVRRQRRECARRQDRLRRPRPLVVQRPSARGSRERHRQRDPSRFGETKRRRHSARRRCSRRPRREWRQHLRQHKTQRFLVIAGHEFGQPEHILGQDREVAPHFRDGLQLFARDVGRRNDIDDHPRERAPRQPNPDERPPADEKSVRYPVVERGERGDGEGNAGNGHVISPRRMRPTRGRT